MEILSLIKIKIYLKKEMHRLQVLLKNTRVTFDFRAVTMEW